jgi:hypothetical protein
MKTVIWDLSWFVTFCAGFFLTYRFLGRWPSLAFAVGAVTAMKAVAEARRRKLAAGHWSGRNG